MPNQIASSCTACHKTYFGGGGYCPKCKPEHDDIRRARDRKRYADDEYRRFLDSPAWRKLSALLRRQNPMCQAITEYGQPCRYKSDAVQHILDGRKYPELRLDPANLVAICDHCHNNAAGDMGKYRYTPTKLSIMGIEQEHAHYAPRDVSALFGDPQTA